MGSAPLSLAFGLTRAALLCASMHQQTAVFGLVAHAVEGDTLVPSKRGSLLMEDLAAIDAIVASNNRLGLGGPPIPVVTRVYSAPASGAVAAGPVMSDPVDAAVSDHYRTSSPNRNRDRDDTRMRHRRLKR